MRLAYGMTCGAIGAFIGATLAAGPPATNGTYAAQHASDCEKRVAMPDQPTALVCAGYQQGRFDETVDAAKRAWGERR